MSNVGFRQYNHINRADKSLVELFRGIPTPNIDDNMNRMFSLRGLMPYNKAPLLGTAFTVRVAAGNNLMFNRAIDLAQPGDVIVIDAFGETSTSIWGGLMSGLARNAGIVGAVIDGSCRDTDEAKLLGFPITAKVSNPRAAHTATSGRKEPIEINVPITCGGVIVHPGDLIVADEIGVAVVPYDMLAKIYPIAREQANKEIDTRKEILNGATVDELLKKFGRI